MRRPTPLTIGLIVANILAFAWEVSVVGQGLVVGGGNEFRLIAAGALVPGLVRGGEYWRLIAAGFLHGSAMHLAVNMYSLLALGRVIETAGGTRRMAIIYFVSLVGSSLAVTYLGGPSDVTVGASGAIFGLFGSFFAMCLRLGQPGMRLIRANLGILALNLFITFAVPGISRWGHVGGLVVGFLVGLQVFPRPRVMAGPDVV